MQRNSTIRDMSLSRASLEKVDEDGSVFESSASFKAGSNRNLKTSWLRV